MFWLVYSSQRLWKPSLGLYCCLQYSALQKKLSGRKYAKNILRTGGSVGIYIYARVDNWWISLSFILRTAQHWLELNKEFSNSKHSYKSKCAISHTLQLIPFFSEWTSVEWTHTHWVYLLSKVPHYICLLSSGREMKLCSSYNPWNQRRSKCELINQISTCTMHMSKSMTNRLFSNIFRKMLHFPSHIDFFFFEKNIYFWKF
jgi:hypothetical protein